MSSIHVEQFPEGKFVQVCDLMRLHIKIKEFSHNIIQDITKRRDEAERISPKEKDAIKLQFDTMELEWLQIARGIAGTLTEEQLRREPEEHWWPRPMGTMRWEISHLWENCIYDVLYPDLPHDYKPHWQMDERKIEI